jgi:hypothetical protein
MAEDSRKRFPKAFICILMLAASIQVVSTSLLSTFPISTDLSHVQFDPSNLTSQQLVVDIYTENAGRGPNVPIGTFTIGDTIKYFVFLNQNCTIEEDVITPDGSTWLRMAGPVNNGTMIEYFDAQYPTGKWAFSVKAQKGAATASDTAVFYVVDKSPYTSTKTTAFNNVTTIEEARFDGKVVKVYQYPVGGVSTWDVLVQKVYFGPEIRNLTIRVQALAITYTLGYPSGYVDNTIKLGDQVEVYGLVNQKGNDTSVTLNGSEDYYIKKLSTLDQSPQIILFSRQVFSNNLTVRIEGITIPGNQNSSITNVNWNWGDGQSSDQQFPATHTYAEVGTYVILVKVLQSDGLATIKSISISVQENQFSQNPTTPWGRPSVATDIWIVLAAVVIVIVFASFMLMRSRTNKQSR